MIKQESHLVDVPHNDPGCCGSEVVVDLFERACLDAGFDPTEDVRLFAFDGPPPGPVAKRSWGRYYARGGRGPLHREPFPFTADDDDAMTEAAETHRIAVFLPPREEEILGLLRAELQHARQAESTWGAYSLGYDALVALGPVYHRHGAGTGVVWNANPLMRDANAHAADLVARVYGPQPGHLRGDWGVLFRTDNEVQPLDRLAARVVVFAALHPGPLLDSLVARCRTLDAVLCEAHPCATTWWDTLIRDDTFHHLSEVAPVFEPTVAEKAAFADAPGEAWRPLEGLIDRAHAYGMQLISS